MDAFRSVRGALLQTLHSLILLPSDSDKENRRIVNDGEGEGVSFIETKESNRFEGEKIEKATGTGTVTGTVTGDGEMIGNHWHIYVTGHSLGGALATLFSFELGRMRAGTSIICVLLFSCVLLYYTILYYDVLYYNVLYNTKHFMII